MHASDPLQLYAQEYMQRRLDEAAQHARLASLTKSRSTQAHWPATLALSPRARRRLADGLRALAHRLDPQATPPADRRFGIARSH